MKALNFLTLGAAGQVVIPAPPGTIVRIVSILSIVSVSEDDTCTIVIGRSNQTVLLIPSGQLSASVTNVAMFIGGNQTDIRQAMTDPVTGVISYSQNIVTVSAPLPDIWWPFEVVVTADAQSTSTVIAYEVSEAPKPKAAPKKA